MGILSQLGLLLWKNVKLRQRRPILTVTQLGWPILIFIVIALLRVSFPPKDTSECHFNARAVPSAGVLPFMQSMVCDFDSPCMTDSIPSNEVPTLADAQIGKVVEDLDPLFQNDTILKSVRTLPNTLRPITELAKVVEVAVKNLTAKQPTVADLFQNVSEVKDVLETIGIPREVSDVIFNASLDILEVLDLYGSLDVVNAVCNETFLGQYLTFPLGSNITAVSTILCDLTADQRQAFANLLPKGLDVDYIANELEEFARVIEPYTLEEFVQDLTNLQEELEEVGELDGLINILPQLVELSKLAPAFKRIFEEYQKGQLERILDEIAPVLERLDEYLEGLPWWQDVTEIVRQVEAFMDAVAGDGSKDRGILFNEFIQNATGLAQKLNLTQDVLESILSQEILPSDLPLLLELLEYPNRTADLICYQNISHDASVSSESSLVESLTVLCSYDINDIVAAIGKELNVTAFLRELQSLVEDNRNPSNQTTDWQEFFSQAIDLVDQLRTAQNTSVFELARDLLENLDDFDLNALNPLLDFLLDGSMGGFLGNGTLGGNSLTLLDTFLQPLLTLLQVEVMQTSIWPHVQKQLLIQYLSIDLQLEIVNTFASGNCPEGWSSQTPSCYRYGNRWVDFESSIDECTKLHGFSHPVVVNHGEEQKFLEEIGEDLPTWLGIDILDKIWLDGSQVYYTNWDKGEGQEGCGVAIFGDGGLWYTTECNDIAQSLCEVPQEHALITLLRNSPQDDLNGLILQIGPEATEILLKDILSPLFIESVINSTFSNATFELCSESFLAAITPLVTTDQLVEICMFDPVAFWERQRAYWKFPEIQKKFLDIVLVSITDPRDIDPSVLELASFNSLILKQIEYQDAIASSLLVPFDPAALSPDVDVTGTPEEWAAAFERLGNYLNLQMLQQLADQMSGNLDGLFGELLSDPSVQQQFAIQEVTNLLVEASNAVYDLVEDLSVGNITAKGPETVKFLSGVQLMLKQSRDIQTAIMETMLDPVKSSQYYSALASDNLFCNPTARSALLTLSAQSQKAFDDYICVVDYGVLAQELAVLLQVPEIDYLITFYIIDSSASELLPIPDQQYTQELWEELIVNLMNIDEVMQQFIVTYNLTFVDGLPMMPLNMNLTSVMDNLAALEPLLTSLGRAELESLLTSLGRADLEPLLTSLGLDEEIIRLVESIINIPVPWDANSTNRLLESMADILQLAGNSTLLEPILSNMLTNDLVTVTLRDIFRASTGKVYVFPDDLGSATSPNDIENLIPLVYSLPDVVQVMLGVLNDEQKAMQLFSSPDVRSIFCSDTSLDFLNSSFSAGVDLAGLQSVMCDVNFPAIAAEASSLPAIQNLFRLGNLSVPSGFNLTAYNIHQEELNQAIQDFIQKPIVIEVSQPWLNATKSDLLQVLINYNSYQTDPARLQDLESLLQYLNELMMEDMANVTWAEDVRMAVQTAIASLSYANDILKVLPGQNVTLADILPPNLAEYVSNSIYYGVDINVLQLQALVNQEQLLAMAMSGDVLGAICGNVSSLDSLLVVPPEVNLTAAHVVLCSFNETAIGIEVMREVGKIVEKAQVETDIAESMAVVEEFIENIITLSQVPPDFIRFDEEWIRSNALKWEAVFISLEATYNKTLQENMNDFGMEMLFNFLQEALKDDPGFQSWLIQIRLEDYIVSILIETLTDLKGKNISYKTLNESLQGLPTLQEALTFREVIPEMVDVLLSLSSNQEKSTQFFSSPNPFATACASGTFKYFFEVPENSTTDVATLETKICGLNQTAIFLELDRYLGISQIQYEIASILADDPSLPPVNFTAMFLRDAQLEAVIEELVRNPPAININEELWQKTRTELEVVLALWQKEMNNLMNPATAIGDISSLLGMIEGQLANFENETWYLEMVSNLRLMDYVNTLATEWTTRLQGQTLTLPRLEEIFENTTYIRDLLALSDLTPDIVDAFLTLSLQTDKWNVFWGMPNPIATLCASGNFTSFFELPPDSTSDIQAVASAVCSVNITAVDKELVDIFNLDEILYEFTRILYNDPSLGPYNWTASYLLSEKVTEAIAGLITNPPIIRVDSIWWTETVTELEAVLQQWSSLVNGNGLPISGQNMTTVDDLAGLIRNIEEQLAIYQNETWYLELISSLRAMDLINQIVIDWANRLEGQTLTLPTLDEVFGNTTYVKQLLSLSSIAPDIVEAFLSLTLEEEKWNDFWAAENPIATACASGDFEGFFQLAPDSTSNITAVAAALCSVNLTAVDRELNGLFMLDDTFTQLVLILYNGQQAVGPYNWTASYQLSLEVQDAINDLILNPPDFVADPTWLNRTRSDLLAVIESWWNAFSGETGNPDPVSQFEMIFDLIESSVLPSISNTSWYQGVVQQMRIMDEINQIILHWTRELKGTTIVLPHFDGLLDNATNVRELLALQDLTPELIEIVMSLSMQPDKFAAFFEMDQPLLTVCENGSLGEYFDLPPESNVDVSVVQSALCSVNLTAVEIELSHLLNLDAIILRILPILYNDPSLGPYNWTASFILSQQVQEAFSDLFSGPPLIELDPIWLNDTLSGLRSTFSRWSATLMDEVNRGLAPMSLEGGLLQLEESLRQAGIWDQVQPSLDVFLAYAHLSLAIGQSQVDDLQITLDVNIPPELAGEHLGYSPQEIQTLVIDLGILPAGELLSLHKYGLWDTAFCSRENNNTNTTIRIYYPPDINDTVINNYLCDLGPEQYFKDLEAYYGFNMMEFSSELDRAFYRSPTNDYDWERLLNLTEEAITLFEEIAELPATHLQDTDFVTILERLNEVQLATLQKDIDSVMKSLEPIVSFFNQDGLTVQLIEGIIAEIETINKWLNMVPSNNMTIGDLSPIAACELMAPVIRQTFIGPLLMNSDLFIQLVNQLYFDLPEYEGQIQELLRNQTLVTELFMTLLSVSPDIVTSWEGVSEEYFKLVLLRALSVDIIEGNLGDATCSEENLRALLELSDSEDIAALSSLICSVDAVIQTELIQRVLIIIDFESAASKIRQLGDSNTNPLEEFSCSSFINNGQEFTSNVITLINDPTAFQLNLEIPGLAELVDDIFSLLENVTQGDLQEFETLLDLLEIFIGEGFFDETDTAVIEELLNLYDLYLQSLDQQTGLIPIYSMWFNSSDVGYLLIRETGLSIQNVSMLMNGYLNSTEISELSNLTVLTWSRVVCEEDVFGRLIVLPSDELLDLVHTELCQHPDKERLFGELQQMFSLFNFLRETAMANVPTPSFTEYLFEIVTRIDILNTSVIENFLESTLPALQEIDDLSDVVTLLPLLDNITQVLNSVEQLLNNLEPVFGGSPVFQQVRELLELLIENKYIVDVLRELPDLTLRKIIQDPEAFQAFLENELGIDPTLARNILDSQIRFESLLSFNASEFKENICSVDLFSRYLVFADGTNLTAVVETLCGQGTRDVINILRVLLTQLDLTGSVDALTSNGLTDLFTNMTSSLQNISLALNDVQNLQGALPQLLASTSSLGEIFDDDTIERISRGETSALFEDNPDLFCGSAGTSRKRRRRQAPSGSSSDFSNGFCEDLYASLQEGEFGDLQWAFFQPILHGKIFYTPDTPVTRKIIEKANRPFQDILDVHDTAKAWLSGVGQLTDLLSSQGFNDIQTLLDNAYIRQLLESELEVDSGSLRSALQGDLTSLPTDSIDQITVLAELVFNLTSCIELDRFKGFQSDELLAEEATFLHSENRFLAAIQFFGVDDLSDDSEIPKHMKYALRMDSARIPTTRDLLNLYWYPTSRSDFATQEQYLHGYVFLQDLVERSIIQLHADNGLELSDVYIQQMPYPCHQSDRFLFIATIIFPLLFIVGFLVLIAIMTHQLVYEKERGIEELMKVMGLHGGVNWLAWFIINAILLTVLMLIIILIVYVGGILNHSKVMVVFIFFICYVFAVIMMSYMSSSFFQTANIASLGSVLLYFFLYLPFGFIFVMGGNVSRAGSYAVSLAAPSAFCFGSLVLTRYEHQGVGSTWDNIWDNPRPDDDSSMAGSCIMLVIDGILYFIIGWYVRTVFPGKYGVPRKWHFFLQPSYWFRCIRPPPDGPVPTHDAVNEAFDGATPLSDLSPQVEAEPRDHPVGIAIENLTKVYDTRCSSYSNRALDEMTLNVFEDQVTALLGCNGAGKTTAISIITGMFQASSGAVSIYGKKVGQAGGQRNDLGLCPQHNALYDELTVNEHLEIYGNLQGLDSQAIRDQGVILLEDLRMSDMLEVPVRNLSGGMKRKLCVAISLIGDAKTIILDEPTSGVDPHARRAVWDLIIRSKRGRTIVLCTHFMDEADLLGDRIAILDRGKLRCCGSSAYLKSKFTTGMKLTLAKERPSGSSTPDSAKKLPAVKEALGNEYSDLPVHSTEETKELEKRASTSSSGTSSNRDLCDSAKVTEFLTSKVSSITLIKEVGSELVYQLSSSLVEKAKYPQLFRDLDQQLEELHIRSYGVSDTKLEEVFLKVSTHSDSYQESNIDQPLDNTFQERSDNTPNPLNYNPKDLYGSSLSKAFQQFHGVILKRFHITRRDWRSFLWSVIMPVVFVALGTLMVQVAPKEVYPQLQLTPAMFRNPTYMFFSNGETDSIVGHRLTDALFGAPGIGTTCMADADQQDLYPCSFTEAFFPDPIKDLTSQERQSILQDDFSSPKCECTDSVSVCPRGSGGLEPPQWVTNTSAIIQDLTLKTDVGQYILNTRHIYQQERYGGLTLVDTREGTINKTILKAWYSNIGYHALPTYINVANNVLLRASVGNQADPAEYGITAYNNPIDLAEDSPDVTGWMIASAQFGMILFIMSSLALIPSILATLMVQENINGAKRLHFVSGASPLNYWLTNLLWDWLVYLIPAAMMVVVLVLFNVNALTSADNIGAFIMLLLLYGYAIFCQYYLFAPFFLDAGTAFVVYFCSNFLLFILTSLPKFLDYLQLGGREPSEWTSILGYCSLVFTPYSISSALLNLLYTQLEVDFFAGYGVTRLVNRFELVRWNIFSMFCQGTIAFLLLMFVEYRRNRRNKCSTPYESRVNEREDEDVEEERQRVGKSGGEDDIISLKDITKVYQTGNRRITAVDNISLGVPRGECFGLLGVNGAGKTTLFRTITADIPPTDGSITLNAESIGYCPQVDAVYDQMTGEEILYCYARLKGIKEKYVRDVVEDIISRLKMQGFVETVISTYSGGMKRTLSVAIALLGNPQLVLMDEPTAGMDPISKQAVWRGIQATIMEGRSVIVTSHSMEECENLCTRLAIMVNGRFRCLGSPQHVKHRHGDGYTLILHLLSGSKPADPAAISAFMDATFPNNVLKEHHLTMLRYQLRMTGLTVADIYEAIENKRDVLGIEDYSVTQTTLDQVFVNFAKRQKEMCDDDDTSSTSSLGGHINPAFDQDAMYVV